jgi:hypothetical protein
MSSATANGTKRTCPVLSPGETVASIRDMNGTKSGSVAEWFIGHIQRVQVIVVLRYVQPGKPPPPDWDKRDMNGKNRKLPASKTGQGHGPLYIRGPSVPFRPGAFSRGKHPIQPGSLCLPYRHPR